MTAFATYNLDSTTVPALISVPHAGRDYDSRDTRSLRVSRSAIAALEDRFADRLADAAVAAGVPAIVAHVARLTIDLNRAPDDLNPAELDGPLPRAGNYASVMSARARSGLGLVPTRLARVGQLRHNLLDPHDVSRRVHDYHSPYHRVIAEELVRLSRAWDAVLLIDLHSMPPLDPPGVADIVIGNRLGTTASPAVTHATAQLLRDQGFRVAINAPYAGGYIIERHAASDRNIHALQIEFDKRLYLDAAFDQPAAGLSRMQQVIVALIDRLAATLIAPLAAAAE